MDRVSAVCYRERVAQCRVMQNAVLGRSRQAPFLTKKVNKARSTSATHALFDDDGALWVLWHPLSRWQLSFSMPPCARVNRGGAAEVNSENVFFT